MSSTKRNELINELINETIIHMDNFNAHDSYSIQCITLLDKTLTRLAQTVLTTIKKIPATDGESASLPILSRKKNPRYIRITDPNNDLAVDVIFDANNECVRWYASRLGQTNSRVPVHDVLNLKDCMVSINCQGNCLSVANYTINDDQN